MFTKGREPTTTIIFEKAIAGTLSSQQQQQAEAKEKWTMAHRSVSLEDGGTLIQRSIQEKSRRLLACRVFTRDYCLWKKETAFCFS
jgi:hypothetical protein